MSANRNYTGKLIRHHRSKKRMTLKRLGHRVGVNNQYVSAIEKGRRPLPPARFMLFAEVLDIKPGMLKSATSAI